MAGRRSRGFIRELLVTQLFPFLLPGTTAVSTYTTCRGDHLAYPCQSPNKSSNIREALPYGKDEVGSVFVHDQNAEMNPSVDSDHISFLPRPARQGADQCWPPPSKQPSHSSRASPDAHADDGRARVISHQPLSSVVAPKSWCLLRLLLSTHIPFWNFTAMRH